MDAVFARPRLTCAILAALCAVPAVASAQQQQPQQPQRQVTQAEVQRGWEDTFPSPPATPELTGKRLRLYARGAGSIGAAPAPTLGVLAGIGVQAYFLSADAELRVDAPAGTTIRGHDVRTQLVAGDLVECWYMGWRGRFFGCAVWTLGAMNGEVVGVSQRSTFHLAVGPRIGFSLPFGRRFAIESHADLPIALTSQTLSVPGANLWSTPTVSGLFGLGLLGRFL